MTKADVRARAAELGLRTAAKPDSQDVCFITSTGGRRTFLGSRIPLHSAAVRDTAGETLGSIDAVEMVTLGQRRGLPLSGAPERRYVVGIDVPGRTVTIGSETDLLVQEAQVRQLVWTDHPVSGRVLVQASAHGATTPADIDSDGIVRWEQPQRAVAPGQSLAFYDSTDTTVLGGGIVAS
jgi:tRNA-specific 2-thiouridylase